jgi:hypothetical protein
MQNEGFTVNIQLRLAGRRTEHAQAITFVQEYRWYGELEARLSVQITDKAKKTLQLLESHQFYTAYCRDLLTKGKLANIEFIKRSTR